MLKPRKTHSILNGDPLEPASQVMLRDNPARPVCDFDPAEALPLELPKVLDVGLNLDRRITAALLPAISNEAWCIHVELWLRIDQLECPAPLSRSGFLDLELQADRAPAFKNRGLISFSCT